jgi:hypothetical protein
MRVYQRGRTDRWPSNDCSPLRGRLDHDRPEVPRPPGRAGCRLRFVILTNEVPRFTDASGALAARFIVLVLTNTFLGREDPALTDTLLAESPGIFNWALDGLDRLLARGYFEQPAVSRDAMQRLEDLASPVSVFVRDRCVIDPIREIAKDDLWAAWKDWCIGEGKDPAGTKAVFYRDLHAAYPGLRATRPEKDGKRIHVYVGIDLRSLTDPDDDPENDLEQQLTGPLTTPDGDAPVRVGSGREDRITAGQRSMSGVVRGLDTVSPTEHRGDGRCPQGQPVHRRVRVERARRAASTRSRNLDRNRDRGRPKGGTMSEMKIVSVPRDVPIGALAKARILTSRSPRTMASHPDPRQVPRGSASSGATPRAAPSPSC